MISLRVEEITDYHRSHFGPRYTLGLLRLRKPFFRDPAYFQGRSVEEMEDWGINPHTFHMLSERSAT